MSEHLTVCDLPSRAVIRVVGADWKSFLQGLVTQDVETLTPGEIRYGALLTPQGRLLFDLFLAGTGDGVLVDCLADARDDLIRRLTLYRLRAKITIEPDAAAVRAL
ncbi:MAG TPA: folate-binding protein, partial [Caulobacteraceae bacterium]|nr:folate-binding protein [Caulobacteraceae bacterium]